MSEAEKERDHAADVLNEFFSPRFEDDPMIWTYVDYREASAAWDTMCATLVGRSDRPESISHGGLR